MPAATKGHTIGLIAIFLNVIFWGIAPAVIKLALDVIPAHVFLYYRFVAVVAICLPFVILFKSIFNTVKKPKDLLELVGVGLLTNPLSLWILFIGLSYTTSASAAVIASTIPLLVIAASAIFLKEKITLFEIVGSLIATVGTVFIIFDTPVQTAASNPLLGNVLVFLYNILWTIGILLMKQRAQKHHPFVFGFTGWVTGMIVMGIVTAIASPVYFLRPLMLTQLPQAFWPILYMAVFGSIIAFTAYQVAQKYIPAGEVSIFTYLEPLVTLPLSLFWLREQISFIFLIGCAVIVVGVVIAEWHGSSRLTRIFQRHFPALTPTKKRPRGRLSRR
jgi:drug/metabolite transporter (DMT)-like permease